MILNYVLCVAVFIALAVGSHAHAVSLHIRTADSALGLTQAEMLAESGLLLGVDILRRQRPGTLPNSPFSFQTQTGSVTLIFEDEGGKADINQAPLDLLSAIIGGAGFTKEQKEEIITGLRGARASGRKLNGLQDIPTGGNVSSEILDALYSSLTAHSGISFVDSQKANSSLQNILRQNNSELWSGSSSGSAYNVVAIARSKKNVYILNEIWRPDPLSSLGLTRTARGHYAGYALEPKLSSKRSMKDGLER